MKKILFLLISIPFFAFNQGGTDFENTSLTPSYLDGQFIDGGITFVFNHSRDQENFPITGLGLMLRRASDSYLEFTVPNGVGTLTFEYRKAFTSTAPRELELLVNGVQVATTPGFGSVSGEETDVYTFNHNINLSGSVDIKIKNIGATSTNRQTVIDNLSWTAFGSTPTCDAPTNLAIANIGETSAVASWDNGGTETEWLVVYGPTGFIFNDYANNSAVTEITTSDNPYTITGLDDETDYDVYVIAKCGPTLFSSELGPVTFTTLSLPVTCDAPTNLAIANIGETSAVASWDNGGTETEWLVVYGPTGFIFNDYANNSAVTEITTSDNPYTITGLDDETDYDVYVIAKCGPTLFSSELGPITFTTLAGTPVTCDAPTNLAIANIGETSAVASWDNGGTETEWLVVYGPTGFIFNDYANNSAVTEITTSDNPYTITGLDDETDYDVYVIAKCGSTLFSSELGPVTFTTLSLAVTCDAPTNLTIDDIQATYGVASWDNGGTETEWLVVYGPSGFIFNDYASNPYVSEATTSINPFFIIGLDAETAYDVYVIAKCGPTLFSSEVGPVTFTTLAGTPTTCDAPTNLSLANVEETSAVASWTAGGSETEWLVVYGPTGFDFTGYANNSNVTEVTTSDNPYSIVGLDAKTSYDVYVIAKCDANLFSTELGPETFTTKTSSLEKHDFAKFSFYPNPTQNELNLKSGLKIENVTVYDMLGKNVVNISPNALTTKVNTQKLHKGVYIMSVTINGVQETYRVIKN